MLMRGSWDKSEVSGTRDALNLKKMGIPHHICLVVICASVSLVTNKRQQEQLCCTHTAVPSKIVALTLALQK